MKKKNIKDIKAKVNYIIPKDLISQYATNISIQKLDNEYRLIFYQINPPLRLNNNNTAYEYSKEIKTMDAVCVASVTINKEKFKEFVYMLNGFL